MSAQTQKVDVLAVMDDAFAELRRIDGCGAGDCSVAADRLDQARSAVAKLIEAANRTIRYADSEPDGDQVVEVSRANIRDLRAAVALAGGAA